MKRWIILALLLCFTGSIFAQTPTMTPAPDAPPADNAPSARFSASNLQPLTGQVFTVTLTVEVPPRVELIGWDAFPPEWGPFEVTRVEPVTVERRADGFAVHTQRLEARLWRPGDARTPDTLIHYRLDGVELRVPARAELFTVPTVLDFNDLNLKPMRPPVDLFVFPFGVIPIIGVVVYFVGRGLWTFYRGRYGPLPELPRPPALICSSELQAVIDNPNLPAHDQITATADALRRYVTGRFDVAAVDLTTDETLSAISARIDAESFQFLRRVLLEADMVKFAGKPADPEWAPRAATAALRWVQVVEARLQGIEL